MKQLRYKVWIEAEGEMFLGNGRVQLLEAIDALGSISAAAKSMNLSYKKAWEQVNHMNTIGESPLVERTTGGKGGGGTLLTEAGKQAVDEFRRIVGVLDRALKQEKLDR